VGRGTADLGITGEVTTSEPVICSRIMEDELVGIAPPGLFSSKGAAVSRSEFEATSLLLGAEGSSTRILTERYLERARCHPARIWAFDSYEAIKRAVADGVGVSFISQLLVREEIDRGELVPFRLAAAPPMTRPIYAVRSTATQLAPQGAAFIRLVVKCSRRPPTVASVGDLR